MDCLSCCKDLACSSWSSMGNARYRFHEGTEYRLQPSSFDELLTASDTVWAAERVVQQAQRTRFAHFTFSQHDKAELDALRFQELGFAISFVEAAGLAVEYVFDVFFFLGAFGGIAFSVVTEELKEDVYAVEVDKFEPGGG